MDAGSPDAYRQLVEAWIDMTEATRRYEDAKRGVSPINPMVVRTRGKIFVVSTDANIGFTTLNVRRAKEVE